MLDRAIAREPVVIHGFRVVPLGSVSPGFKAGLRRLAAKGFVDDSCTIVKTASGPRSGITHAGGRYVHPLNAYAESVAATMREQGLEIPPMPFLVAPGAGTLFHEFGHHVDHVWSREERAILFSFRWFSRFYWVSVRPRTLVAGELHRGAPGPIRTEEDATTAALVWGRSASELFADLFEDWVRAEGRCSFDCCDPSLLNGTGTEGSARLELLPGADADTVRETTYALFREGLGGAIQLPEVRGDLFGEHTAMILGSLERAMEHLRGQAADTACAESPTQG
ncbi:MAG: hypothetical protein HYV07_27240 [Deltaproteobacteria bacterium]|nr:hypothetical protein [Deltaproteobacteria bacterium]